MDAEDRENVRIKTALGRIMTCEHVRLCVPALSDASLSEIETLIAYNGGTDGPLAKAADELCASGGLMLGEDADPFGLPVASDDQ